MSGRVVRVAAATVALGRWVADRVTLGGRTDRDARAPRLLAALGVVLALHLGAHLAGAMWLAHATKPALLPLLAGYAAACRGPRLLVTALLFGWGGDVLLQIGSDLSFLAGMGSFAAGHVCYLLLFCRLGGRRGVDRRVVLGYATLWAGLLAAMWPGLDAFLRGPVAAYSLLLAVVAVYAARLGIGAGVGAALFLLSDTLIATDLAGWPQLPVAGFWVMLTYVGAQYLLTDATLAASAPGAAAAGTKTTEGRATRTSTGPGSTRPAS